MIQAIIIKSNESTFFHRYKSSPFKVNVKRIQNITKKCDVKAANDIFEGNFID